MKPETLSLLDRRVPRYTSYPTAPHFTPVVGEEAYRGWLSRLSPVEPVSLYVHVPFCAVLCWYCGCNTRVVRASRPMDDYLDQLATEADLVGASLPGRLPVGHLHLGGGTPNQLNPAQLERLFLTLADVFAISEGAEVSVELDPRRLDAAQVETLASLGVTRASLGVQDFDPVVQRAVNRVQPFELVARAVDDLRNAGIEAINFDLMYGLPHQTVDGVTHTAELAAGLRPDRIALFGYAHVPWMKRHQARIDEAALPDAAARSAQEQAAAARLVGLGYKRIGLDHFARAKDPMAVRLREGGLRRNFQGYTTDPCTTLIGLGPSAIGAMPDGYVQNHADPVAYREALSDHRLPVARGCALTPDDLFRRDIIERLMCDLTVNLGAIAARHGADPRRLDLDGVDALATAGICERRGLEVSVPEANRPLVRLVCAAFDAYLGDGGARHSRAV